MKGHLVAVVVALALAARYAYRLWRYPYVPCPWCNGGRKWASGGKVYGRCWWCKGAGERVRLSRRLLGWLKGKS